MANRTFSPARNMGRDIITLTGSFAPNGSSALAAASTYGAGFSVARTSEGLFTVTLQDVYYRLLSATATLQLASKDNITAQIGDYDSSAKTLQIRLLKPYKVFSATVDLASIDANTTTNTDVTVAGLASSDYVVYSGAPALENGLVVQGVSVPATNTLRVRVSNVTAAPIDSASQSFFFVLMDETLSDVAANADNRVNFVCQFQNGSIL